MFNKLYLIVAILLLICTYGMVKDKKVGRNLAIYNIFLIIYMLSFYVNIRVIGEVHFFVLVRILLFGMDLVLTLFVVATAVWYIRRFKSYPTGAINKTKKYVGIVILSQYIFTLIISFIYLMFSAISVVMLLMSMLLFVLGIPIGEMSPAPVITTFNPGFWGIVILIIYYIETIDFHNILNIAKRSEASNDQQGEESKN